MTIEGIDNGPKSEPVVLIIHGVLTSLKSWEPIISALSHKYRVVGANLRGHGGSEVLERPYGPEDLAGDVVSFVRELSAQQKPVFLIGHSLGSAIGLHILTNNLLRVAKAMLISPTPRFQLRAFIDMVSNSTSLLKQLSKEEARHLGLSNSRTRTLRQTLKNLLLSLATTTEAIRETVSNITNSPIYVISRIIQDFIIPWEATSDELTKISVPVLLVAGENDPVIPVHRSMELLSLLPNADMEVIKNGTHFLPTENSKEILILAQKFFAKKI